MIWWLLGVLVNWLPVRVTHALSWVLLPFSVHGRLWDRPWACRYGLHDYRLDDRCHWRCRRCGKLEPAPALYC